MRRVGAEHPPYGCDTFCAAAFPGRREHSLSLFLVAWEGHQADKKAT